MPLTTLQTLTLNHIRHRHRGNEIRGKEIAVSIGLKPRSTGKEGADMRSIIHALRVHGFPICANGKGYYWALDDGDLSDFTESFRNRIADQEKALAGMQLNRDYKINDVVEI